MYCRHCGQKLSENAKFCGKCGAKVDMMQGDDASFVTEEAGNNQQPASAQEPDNDKNPRQGKLWWKIVLIVVICAAAVAVCLFGWHEIRERQFRNHMEVAQTYIDEKDYDEAIEELLAAIDIDPKVVEPYIQLADVYKELGNTEMVEGTIDSGRAMIVDTYERKGELPEDSETLYVNAVVDAVENDDNDRAEKIGKEYVDMVDEQAANDFKEKVEEKLNIEPDPDPEPIPDSEPPSEETVLEMLGLFEYWTDDQLFNWYTTDERYHNEETVAEFSSYEDIGMSQACTIAGRILGDQGEYEYAQDFSPSAGGGYGRLSISQLDEYLSDLFGMTYNAEDFAEHADETGNEVEQDEEGQIYVLTGDYGAMGVDVSIENIADMPDEDGTYKVLARYDEFYDDDIPEDTYYVQFRFKPDEDSKYGYVIVGMVPAGYGEIDPEFSAEDTDDEEDNSTADADWAQLYADYIEQTFPDDSDNGPFYLVYLNQDDVPEMFCSKSSNGENVVGLLYVNNGVVKEESLDEHVHAVLNSGSVMTRKENNLASGGPYDDKYILNENNEFINASDNEEDNSTQPDNGLVLEIGHSGIESTAGTNEEIDKEHVASLTFENLSNAGVVQKLRSGDYGEIMR